MKIVIDNRRRETYSDRLSIVGDNRPITSHHITHIWTTHIGILVCSQSNLGPKGQR
jgi:hypothetical protein